MAFTDEFLRFDLRGRRPVDQICVNVTNPNPTRSMVYTFDEFYYGGPTWSGREYPISPLGPGHTREHIYTLRLTGFSERGARRLNSDKTIYFKFAVAYSAVLPDREESPDPWMDPDSRSYYRGAIIVPSGTTCWFGFHHFIM